MQSTTRFAWLGLIAIRWGEHRGVRWQARVTYQMRETFNLSRHRRVSGKVYRKGDVNLVAGGQFTNHYAPCGSCGHWADLDWTGNTVWDSKWPADPLEMTRHRPYSAFLTSRSSGGRIALYVTMGDGTYYDPVVVFIPTFTSRNSH